MSKAKYDVSAYQTVPMQLEHNGELFDVAFKFAPLNDDLILNYFKAEDSEDQHSAERYFDREVLDAVNVEFADLDELRAITKSADKRAAVIDGLLGTTRKAPPKATGKLNYKETVPHKSYRLESFFDGAEIETGITLTTPDVEHLRVWRALESGSFPVKFGDQKLFNMIDGLHALYKALYQSCENYADNAVPVHHALLVIGFHLKGYRAVITKK